MSFLPTSGSIGFKITGLNEAIKGLDNIVREWPVVRTAVLNESARFLVNEAKKNVHVVSGDLKRSISIEPGGQKANSVVVSAKMPYSRIENDRKGDKHPFKGSKPPYGTHDYFTKALAITQRDFQSKIKINFDKLLQRNKRTSF